MDSAQTEIARIRTHFDGALALLDARDTRHLDPAAQITRQLLRAELARYQADGAFPKNHDHDGQRPIFIDDHGTPCAMAHLMSLGGAGDLVAEVRATKNHAYLDDLALDPRVRAWLDAAGLTIAEAARIQPGYSQCYAPAVCLCQFPAAAPEAVPVPGAVVATILAQGVVTGTFQAKVETVYGEVPFVPGDSLALRTQDVVNGYRGIDAAIGDRVFVPVPKEPQTQPYLFIVRVAADGSVGEECNMAAAGFGRVAAVGPLTTTQLVEARRAISFNACRAALSKHDACFDACPAARESDAGGVCVYGHGYNDAGSDAGPETGAEPSVDAAPPFTGTESTPTAGPQPSSASGSTSTSTPAATTPPEEFSPGGGCSTSSAAPGSVAVLLAVAGALLARQRRGRSRR